MENRFKKYVDWIASKVKGGDIIEFDLEMFYKYLPFIKNREVLENCIDEENELGESLEWEMIEFVDGV
jgi:hypothetical protein|tara:strand:+ start:40588 stop:40791 length:204 start_codon:yes stop_codon:yes gene_type:complete